MWSRTFVFGMFMYLTAIGLIYVRKQSYEILK